MSKRLILVFFMLAAVLAGEASRRYDSYHGLVMAGYQGWFNTPGDGAARGWYHYKGANGFRPGSTSVDLWPDVSEYAVTYPTEFKYADGSQARVFSSHDPSTVQRHFKWMHDYGVDGVFMQRFVGEIATPSGLSHFNRVLDSAIKAADDYERAVCVMYDLSGMSSGEQSVVLRDIDTLDSIYDFHTRTRCQPYLHHNGKPLVAVWGVGFNDGRGYTLADAEEIIDGLQARGYSVMIGVPTHWRKFGHDTEPSPRLHEIIGKCDIVMPWFVGRYDEKTYPAFKKLIADDKKWCEGKGLDYVPLVYPGFSWANMKGEDGLFIPRNGGRFYWEQLRSVLALGCKMIYVAMFDEIDEGTAIFKTSERVPVAAKGSRFIPLDNGLGSDYFLRLTGEAARALKKGGRLPEQLPSPRTPLTYPLTAEMSNPLFVNFPSPMHGIDSIGTLYTADASAHVWNDGRLYLYASHDMEPARGCDRMDRYHVFSTDDLRTWTDHGEILSAADVAEQDGWGIPGWMWAPDCAYNPADSTYYFYFPHVNKPLPQGGHDWRIGVATSKNPATGFKVVGYIEGAASFIDPCVFVDTDGQPYLYNGGGGTCMGGRLCRDDWTRLDGEMVRMEGLNDFHEATWVHKSGSKYYLSHSDNHYQADGNHMRYAVSDSPLGPWKDMGIYMFPTGTETNHGSIVNFRGQWLAVYHTSNHSGRGNLRSVCIDPLKVNRDGSFEIVRNWGKPHGKKPMVKPGKALTIRAEHFNRGGEHYAYHRNAGRDVSLAKGCDGCRYVCGLEGKEWLRYSIGARKDVVCDIILRVAGSGADAKFHLSANGVAIAENLSAPQLADDNWHEITIPAVNVGKDIEYLDLRVDNGTMNFDSITLRPCQSDT